MSVREPMTLAAPLEEVEGLRVLDREFAALMCRLADHPSTELAWLAALVSHATGQGHICIDLHDPAAALVSSETDNPPAVPQGLARCEALRGSNVIGRPGNHTPLILDENRLYLHRYWDDEQRLAESLLERGCRRLGGVDMGDLRNNVDHYFPDVDRERWQRVAAYIAATRALCVITGGPGTGKTTTVATVAAILLHLAPTARIVLTAPTGKAASRMQQAIGIAVEQRLGTTHEVAERMPREATTVHRLLGARPNGRGFRHGPDNPVGVDILVLDEASMVDLPLMTRLFEALPQRCRVIVVGDRDQLASVEAGAVLGDLCNSDAVRSFSPDVRRDLMDKLGTPLPDDTMDHTGVGLADSLVELTTVYRYHESLGKVSRAVRDRDPHAALALLDSSPDVTWKAPPSHPRLLGASLEHDVVQGFRRYLMAADPAEKLDALGDFRILCALRHGPYGVETLNAVVERILARHELIRFDSPFYAGRPVLVTRNDHALQLYNGDIGFVDATSERDSTGQVLFATPDGGFRGISPHRLPPVETAFALTVHKSQGSEFGSVVLVLPDHDVPVLTRELIYTGLTRARRGACIMADKNLFTAAVRRMSRRTSGLSARLWSTG